MDAEQEEMSHHLMTNKIQSLDGAPKSEASDALKLHPCLNHLLRLAVACCSQQTGKVECWTFEMEFQTTVVVVVVLSASTDIRRTAFSPPPNALTSAVGTDWAANFPTAAHPSLPNMECFRPVAPPRAPYRDAVHITMPIGFGSVTFS